MKSIWKFPLAVTDEQTVALPKGAEILCVQTQDGIPCLWTLVTTGAAQEDVRIFTYGTGHNVMPRHGAKNYIGTYQLEGGSLVFHLFRD